MAANHLKGTIVNTGELSDLGIFGPASAEDPSLLSKPSLVGLLTWFAYRRASGTLNIVEKGSSQYVLAIKDGSLISLERKGLAFIDEVLNNLVAEDVISAGDGAKAQAEASSNNRSVLQVLFESGACTPRALVESIRVTKQTMLDKLFEMPEAAFLWQEGSRAIQASDPVTIDLNLFLVKLARERSRTAYFSELEPFLGSYMGRYPLKSKKLTPAIAGVALTDKERRVVEEIGDGSITLKEVISLSLLSRNMTARLFFFCAMLGFVEFRKIPLPKGGVEALEEELQAALQRMDAEDHFTRLEIHWTSHPKKLDAAYQKMEQRYGVKNKARRQSQQAAELSDQILNLMRESLDVLTDQESRRAYRREIMDETKLTFGTDFLFKQAHLAKFRGELGKAKEIIESAIDVQPKQKFIDFHRALGGE